MTICTAHCVENIESEALDTVILIHWSLLSIIGLIMQSWFTPPMTPLCCLHVRGCCIKTRGYNPLGSLDESLTVLIIIIVVFNISVFLFLCLLFFLPRDAMHKHDLRRRTSNHILKLFHLFTCTILVFFSYQTVW